LSLAVCTIKLSRVIPKVNVHCSAGIPSRSFCL
jgi:hypothetical protein